MHMYEHPLRNIIKACDRAISAKDFDSLMEHYADDAALVIKPGMIVKGKDNIRSAFISISDYFQDQLVVKQGDIQIIEGGGDALVIMESLLFYPDDQGVTTEITRRATYVFRLENDRWLCTIDNSYGTSVLDAEPT